MTMHLVMFDIDGTLTSSFEYDRECFVSAIRDAIGTEDVDSDWSNYRHVSSTGITMEAIERHTGKTGSEEEMKRVESRLMFHLEQRYKECREDFIEVPGAKLMLDKLQEMDHIAISLATGCWADEALFKLDHSGFNLSSVPMASSNDAIAREEILKASLQKVKESNGIQEFKSVTYVGDGIWDLNSALKLGYNFIGIGERLRPLKGNGLRHVHEDYMDIDAFIKSLDEIHQERR